MDEQAPEPDLEPASEQPPESVPESLVGERLDRSLSVLFNLSRSQSSGLIESGAVTVNQKRAKSVSKQLRAGDQIAIDQTALDDLAQRLLPEPDVELTLAHEDEHLLVIDKPAGMVVHPGVGHNHGTLAAGLLARYPEIASVGGPIRPGIVHRLDKGTSGLMMVARTQPAFDFLKQELAQRKVRRQYLAVCANHFENEQGIVDAPIGKSPKNPMQMEVAASGRPARTRYTVKQRLRGVGMRGASLVQCQLETGRTHQIRVHLAAIGHPLVGDRAYNPQHKELLATLELEAQFRNRPALHSSQLSCLHPATRQEMSFESPLPDDMEELLRALG